MKRIGESRKNKAGQTAAKVKADKAEKRTGRKAAAEKQKKVSRLLGEIFYPQWVEVVKDIQSGRIDTAPEYAELRALPDWAAFRASFDADTGKPEAAGAGKPKAKGGKR